MTPPTLKGRKPQPVMDILQAREGWKGASDVGWEHAWLCISTDLFLLSFNLSLGSPWGFSESHSTPTDSLPCPSHVVSQILSYIPMTKEGVGTYKSSFRIKNVNTVFIGRTTRHREKSLNDFFLNFIF